jgi:glucose-6-phosphate isomerase
LGNEPPTTKFTIGSKSGSAEEWATAANEAIATHKLTRQQIIAKFKAAGITLG